MGKDFTADQIGPIDIPHAVRERAARYIAANATDAADCTRLLAMVGLLPAGHPASLLPSDHGMRGYRLGCRCKTCRKANGNRLARQRGGRS